MKILLLFLLIQCLCFSESIYKKSDSLLNAAVETNNALGIKCWETVSPDTFVATFKKGGSVKFTYDSSGNFKEIRE